MNLVSSLDTESVSSIPPSPTPSMTDITYPLFPIVAFLGFILPLIPLKWHLEALNSGTCYFIFWSSLACLNQFVNSIVWANNAINSNPAWCEISIRIMMAASVGLPAASLCINRRLYLISTVRNASISLAEKRRGVLIDSSICILFPLFYVALQYIVQGHRFNIFEEIGCYPALYNTLLAFFISSMWPLLIGLVSMVYCFLSLRSFAQRRLEFGQFLSANTSLTLSRYFRLMGLAMTEICATTPFAIFVIWLNAAAAPIGPWRSWEDTHFNYSRVEQFPAVVWRRNHLSLMSMEFSRWITPLCSFVFFGFFGFAQESVRHYRLAWSYIRKTFGSPSREACPNAKQFKPHNHACHSNVSPSTTVFALPLHDLKCTSTRDSTFSSVTSGKDSCLESSSSSPPSPCSSTVVSFSPSNNGATQIPPESFYKKVSLTRSRTL